MNTLPKALALSTACFLGGLYGGDSIAAQLAATDSSYDSGLVLVRNSNLTSASMELVSSGTLTIKLIDLTFTQALSTLSFSLSSPTSKLLSTTGAGVWTWNVDSPTLLFATVSAVAGAAKNYGAFNVSLSFAPAQLPEQAPVPLPGALWMLLSGIGALSASRFKHTAVTQGVLTNS